MLLSDTRLRWKGADWEMGEKLGYGRFAAVYRARCLADAAAAARLGVRARRPPAGAARAGPRRGGPRQPGATAAAAP